MASICSTSHDSLAAERYRSMRSTRPRTRQYSRISTVERSRGVVYAPKRQLEAHHMPEKETIERARRDAREGKAASTQAGEFVREEMDHIREGKHGARSTKQAIAIGLSKARRAGVPLAPPKKGSTSARTRKHATRDLRAGQTAHKSTPSTARSRAVLRALEREGHTAASPAKLAAHAKQAARTRSKRARSLSAKKAARTRAR